MTPQLLKRECNTSFLNITDFISPLQASKKELETMLENRIASNPECQYLMEALDLMDGLTAYNAQTE
ncbi:hypothetical protein ACFL54_04640 [Planctomycetota bacterium]